MRLNSIAAIVTLAASSLLLTGCATATPTHPTHSTSSSPVPSQTSVASQPDCPDIRAQDFAVQIETTVADPAPMAESVGLGDVLKGACAYGFTSDSVAGVALFIINPSPDAAAVYFGDAVGTAAKAGFAMGDTDVEGQNMTQTGKNADGAEFLVAYRPTVSSGDGVMPDSSMKAIGLKNGESVIIGSIQLAG